MSTRENIRLIARTPYLACKELSVTSNTIAGVFVMKDSGMMTA